MISKDKWQIGQIKERQHHIFSHEEGKKHYDNAYKHYFRYVGLDRDLDGKSVIEVGSADFPALGYCENYAMGYVVEPMPSEILEDICKEKNLVLIKSCAEDYGFPPVDEVWFFNVLQHVLDPDVIIEKAKEAADVIRFFEPIEAGTDQCHHHEFTMDYFRGHFGGCVKYFEPNQGIKGFHTWQNSYGKWTK